MIQSFWKIQGCFFDAVLDGKYSVVISDLTERELLSAPERVRVLLFELGIDFDLIEVSSESISLASQYVQEKVVGPTSLDDCIHIAVATIEKVDLLVSWNFKHIVNIHRIRGYNSLNIKNGYAALEIRSPKDLISYENN